MKYHLWRLFGLLPPYFNLEFDGPSANLAGRFGFSFCTRVWWINVHFCVAQEHRSWGFREDWFDGPLPRLGFGRFMMICAMDHRGFEL